MVILLRLLFSLLMMAQFCCSTELETGSSNDLVLHVQLEEEKPPGTTVLYLSPHLHRHHHTDKHSSLRYQILGESDYFHLDEHTGEISTKIVIDREAVCNSINGRTDSCVLRMDVFANNITSFHMLFIQVEITDVDDNFPEFQDSSSEFYVEVKEGPPIVNGTYAIPAAVDADSVNCTDTEYRIQLDPNSTLNQCFALRWTDAELYLVVVCELDREMRDSYSAKILAFSRSSPNRISTLRLHIGVADINDNAPLFSESLYKFSVVELSPPGSVIGQVTAYDADVTLLNGQVSYQLEKDSALPFTIDSITGIIQVSSSLDFESQSSYSLTVVAVDHGSPALSCTATIQIYLIDSNDIQPEISVTTVNHNNTVTVREHCDDGTFMAHVRVLDGDVTERNNRVWCSINSTRFQLVGSLLPGEYSLTSSNTEGDIDREIDGDLLTVSITCIDSGEPARNSSLTLPIFIEDINDHSPEFPNSSYNLNHVSESDSFYTHVLTVHAIDKDKGFNSQLKYELRSVEGYEASASLFSINPLTGEIVTAAILDYELQPDHRFVVTATDGGQPPRTSSVLINIHLINVNDNAPEFLPPLPYEFTVPESYASYNRLEIGKIQATDADSERSMPAVWYGLTKGDDSPFEIEKETGVIYTYSDLDREKQSQYRLRVMATDFGIPALSSVTVVTITISDINDNSPTFITAPNTTYSVSYQHQREDYMGQVSAHDPDISDLNKLTYTMLSGPDFLGVDDTSGQLQLTDSLSPNYIGLYSLLISVTDSANHSDNVEVIVAITEQTTPASLLARSTVLTVVLAASVSTVLVSIALFCCVRRWILHSCKRSQTYTYRLSTQPLSIVHSSSMSSSSSYSVRDSACCPKRGSGSTVSQHQTAQKSSCTTADSGCETGSPNSANRLCAASRNTETNNTETSVVGCSSHDRGENSSLPDISSCDVFNLTDLSIDIDRCQSNSSGWPSTCCSICQNNSVVTWSHAHIDRNVLNTCFMDNLSLEQDMPEQLV